MTEIHYLSEDLEIFMHATNWKAYLRKILSPYLNGHILEVGAGIGSTTSVLCNSSCQKWICLEPDPNMAKTLEIAASHGQLPSCCEVKRGSIKDLSLDTLFDGIIYIDVLEHIEDDREELRLASSLLAPGGKLIVLAPAHQSLFSPFDTNVGHFRRYSVSSLAALTPANLTTNWAGYLDSVGYFASLANQLILKSSMPSKRQIWIWDKLMVPISKILDGLFINKFGKSVVTIWQKS